MNIKSKQRALTTGLPQNRPISLSENNTKDKVQAPVKGVSVGRKSTYGKYRCQSKKRAIFTKLHEDAGYPQEILCMQRGKTAEGRDFVTSNKQNLHNFFE